MRGRRAALAAALLVALGMASPAPAAAAEAEADAFYRSVLAARDAATLTDYLACFSDERRAALWAALTPDEQAALRSAANALGLAPGEPAGETAETTPQPTPSAADAADGRPASTLPLRMTGRVARAEDESYTLTLEFWADRPFDGDAALAFTPTPEYAADGITPRLWVQDRTSGGWSAVKQEAEGVTAAWADGTLAVSGFDFSALYRSDAPRLDDAGRAGYGARLVLRLEGIRPDYAATLGGRSIPLGTVTLTAGADSAAAPAPAADIPLQYDYAPVDQVLADGQSVNFGYMINPPAGGVGTLPDGKNNAWVELTYAIEGPAGAVGVFTVPAGAAMADGSWDAPLPVTARPAAYAVTVTARAVQPAASPPEGGTAARSWETTARALAE